MAMASLTTPTHYQFEIPQKLLPCNYRAFIWPAPFAVYQPQRSHMHATETSDESYFYIVLASISARFYQYFINMNARIVLLLHHVVG